MKPIKTKEVAELLGVKPRTILLAHSKNKHYCGMKPIKLPNGRLRWDEDAALALLGVSNAK